jgi:hypothetical protein
MMETQWFFAAKAPRRPGWEGWDCDTYVSRGEGGVLAS